MIKANQGTRPKKPAPRSFTGAWRLALGVSPSHPLCDFATLRLCVKTPSSRHDQGSIKAKTPAIKANQASSRQTMKNQTTIKPPVPQPRTARFPVAPTGSRLYRRLATGVPPHNRPLVHANSPIANPKCHPQSSQKPLQSCLIKPHQGKSRHPPKNPAPRSFTGTWRLELGVSQSHPLCDFAPLRLCVITH